MKYLLMACLAAPAWAACLPVEGEHILGKDLAAARPEFTSIDPGLELGFAPNPGVTRVFQTVEMVALAQKFGIAAKAPLQSVCFVRPAKASAQKTAAAAAAAMDVLRGEQVAVEVSSGGALLRLLGDAETSGHVGDSVLVRNPESGKVFQAKVEGKGKVMVRR
jgi:hypothetical protein